MTTPLSAWSSHRTHKALGNTTDKAARLAIALGTVRSIVRVVDRTVPPLTVNWAKVTDEVIRSMSYTDLRGGSIHINPLPLMDGRLDHGAALDVEVGFGLHEASHSQESRDRYEYLLKKEMTGSHLDIRTGHRGERIEDWREVPEFEPMRIAAYLWNIAEDVRIERVTSAEWPGFEPYFDAVLAYMWDEIRMLHELPEAYGPELKDKLRVVFLACRYPHESITLPTEVQPEVRWWKAWQDDYLSDRVDTPTTIQRGLDHLAEDPATANEMAEMAQKERDDRARGEKIKAQLERLMKEGVEGAYGVCITENGEVMPLDEETAGEVDRLVRERLIEHQTIIRTVGAATPPIRVRRPESDAASARAYIGRPDPVVQAMRTALVFRNSAPRHDVKLLKSGTIDDEELYRWGMGDYRVFSERVVESKPDVFMGLLVDLSGSMSGQKLQIAQQLAQIFVHAVHDQEGIETAVWGHTGDYEEEASEVYRIWERGDPLNRLGLISTLPHHNNYDGHAISMVVKSMLDKEQPEKVLLVLADGLPAGAGYGGQPAANHVRAVTRWALRQGVRVIQIAIDPYGLQIEDQNAMFGPENVVQYKDAASLPRQMTASWGGTWDDEAAPREPPVRRCPPGRRDTVTPASRSLTRGAGSSSAYEDRWPMADGLHRRWPEVSRRPQSILHPLDAISAASASPMRCQDRR